MHPVLRSCAAPLVAGLVVTAGAALTAAPASAAAPRHLEGSLPNGTTWVLDLPGSWNGTLLLYSHGYNPDPSTNPARNAPDPVTAAALLGEGYALAGSSYARSGWTMDSAAEDQLATLAAVTRTTGRPRTTLAVGTSLGGLVTAQLAQRGGAVIDGALSTCGMTGGAVDLHDQQLDGAHALNQLLLPAGQRVPLVRFTSPAQVQRTVASLSGAVATAQKTAAGRARVALAAALYELPGWAQGSAQPAPGDVEEQQRQQAAQFPQFLTFTENGRYDVERNAGGNVSTNAGVDYAALLAQAPQRPEVRALYAAAGLDLRADLDTLTRTASTSASPAARTWLSRTSTVSGRLAMPVLTIHTLADILIPVQAEQEYAEDVTAAGSSALLRQAFTREVGHCAFSPAELVASVHALAHRVDTGRWGDVATPVALNEQARRLHLGAATFMPGYRPGQYLGDRRPAPRPAAAR